jgi:hypothetical protein
MSESTLEQSPSNRVIDQRKGRFFVRESYLDETHNEIRYLLSTINPDDPEQEFSVAVPRDHPQMGMMLSNLDGAIMDLSKIHLIRTEGSPEKWQVQDARPSIENDDRSMIKKGEKFATWTPKLGDTVEKFCEYRLFEKASQVKQDLYRSPDMMSEVKGMTEALFAHKAREIFPDKGDDEIRDFLREARVDDSIHKNRTFNDVMSGREVGPEGTVRRVFYHTEYPASEQIDMNGPEASVMSGLYNYCSQASVANMIKAKVSAGGKDGSGLLEKYEQQLVKMKALVGTHPTRTGEDYEILTSEFAELVAGESVRAQMAACGASAANPDYDDISIGFDTKLTGRGQENTYGNEVCQQILKEFEQRQGASEDPFADYLKMESKKAYESARGAKRDVEVAQDEAMVHGKERNPGFSLPEPIEEIKDMVTNGAGAAVKQTIDVIDDMGAM